MISECISLRDGRALLIVSIWACLSVCARSKHKYPYLKNAWTASAWAWICMECIRMTVNYISHEHVTHVKSKWLATNGLASRRVCACIHSFIHLFVGSLAIHAENTHLLRNEKKNLQWINEGKKYSVKRFANFRQIDNTKKAQTQRRKSLFKAINFVKQRKKANQSDNKIFTQKWVIEKMMVENIKIDAERETIRHETFEFRMAINKQCSEWKLEWC